MVAGIRRIRGGKGKEDGVDILRGIPLCGVHMLASSQPQHGERGVRKSARARIDRQPTRKIGC